MDDPSACPYSVYTDGLSDELPFFAQARPKRMIRLQYKSGQCYITEPNQESIDTSNHIGLFLDMRGNIISQENVTIGTSN